MKSAINFDSTVVSFRQGLKLSKNLSEAYKLTKANTDLCLRGEDYIYKNTLGIYTDAYLVFSVDMPSSYLSVPYINYIDSIFLAYREYPVVFVVNNKFFYEENSSEDFSKSIEELENQCIEFIRISSIRRPYSIKYSIISEDELISNKGNIFFKNGKLKEKSNVKIVSKLLPHYLMELIRSKYNATFSIRTKMDTSPSSICIDSYYDVLNNPNWITSSFLFEANDKMFKVLTEKLPPKLNKDITLEINLAGKHFKSKLPNIDPILK